MVMEGKGARMLRPSRQRGYSLVELSFVLIIMLVLAGIVSGGGAFMANQAKGQKVSEKAREFFIAANHSHAKNDSYSKPLNLDQVVLSAALAPYIDSGTTVYQDPYNGTAKLPITRTPPFVQGDYGTAVRDWPAAGNGSKVLYFYNTGATGTIQVCDQDGCPGKYVYRFFAFQAIDNEGRAILTIGK